MGVNPRRGGPARTWALNTPFQSGERYIGRNELHQTRRKCYESRRDNVWKWCSQLFRELKENHVDAWHEDQEFFADGTRGVQEWVRLVKTMYLCSVNDYPEEYCPLMSLSVLPGYLTNLKKRAKLAAKAYCHLLSRWFWKSTICSQFRHIRNFHHARHSCRALNRSHRGMIRPRVILLEHQ